jgi:hypothetical protein
MLEAIFSLLKLRLAICIISLSYTTTDTIFSVHQSQHVILTVVKLVVSLNLLEEEM